MQVLATQQVHEGGADLASAVRELAGEARKALSGAGNAYETQALLRRINSLEGEFAHAPSSTIRNWLKSLRQQLERL